MSRLEPPDVAATEAQVPFSARYGDVYHSAAGALAQAQYVFLRGNGLPERWRGRAGFTVCETGFGLGLNFLALWQAWRQDPQRSARLHVVSLEAHPFAVAELARWHARLLPAALLPLAATLQAQWPRCLPGLHRLDFEQGAVTLTLGFGEASVLVPELNVAVDAYFLDGFAPARNPAMWSPALISGLAEHAAPGATVATWCSAGAVRRSLAAAGFVVRKAPGFAGKRDMTLAHWPEGAGGVRGRQVLAERCPAGHLAVVGAGLAGVGVAAAFARRGWAVTLVAPGSGLAPGAPGGHVAAALTPVAEPGDGVRSRLLRAGALQASQRWSTLFDLADRHSPVWASGTFQVVARRLARRPAAAAEGLANLARLGWPADWLQVMSANEAAALVGQAVSRDGVHYPGALRVQPQVLLATWAQQAAIHRLTAAVTAVRPAAGGGWQVLGEQGGVLLTADRVVLASSGAVPELLMRSGWPVSALGVLAALTRVAGQIRLFEAAALAGGPQIIVAGDGYVLPAVQGDCVVGSTYDHDAVWGQPAPLHDAGHSANLAHVRALLPQSFAQGGSALALARGWAGWRAVLPDRLPAVGWLQPGLGVATAYGSRGLAWSVLAGELLAQPLAGEPGGLERSLVQALSPFRVHKLP